MATKFHFFQQVEKIKPLLKPPVSNHMMFNDDLKIMIVGGPNQRNDYHTQNGEELFYQIVGDMDLVIVNPKTGRSEPVHIKEGEIFLLPAGVSHSPQRYAGTLGLVVERNRYPHEIDNLRWHTDAEPKAIIDPEAKATILYEEYFHCLDLGTEIKEAIGRFNHFLTLPIEERPPMDHSHVPIQDLLEIMKNAKNVDILPPFSLDHHLKEHSELKDCAIFDSEFVVKQFRHFTDHHDTPMEHSFVCQSAWKECYLWQFKGNALVMLGSGEDERFELHEGEALFITEKFVNCKVTIHSETKNDITLFIANNFHVPNLPPC
jgi:3-hydroxyanthranilate 3,4-dioxygenase